MVIVFVGPQTAQTGLTGRGQKLAEVRATELRDHVVVDDEPRPVWRLVAAIEDKAGTNPAGFEAKYGIPVDTVYTWLDRIEERGVADALPGDPRSGRPPKLGEPAWDRFVDHLERAPEDLGYREPAWTPSLVRHHLEAEFGVRYSARHVRRLLDRTDRDVTR